MLTYDIKTELKEISKTLGVDIGFTDAEPMDELFEVLDKSNSTFTTDDITKRITPRKIMDSAQSIIVFVCPYFSGDDDGNISLYARGYDYHIVMKSISQNLEQILTQHGYSTMSLCDNSPLPERYLAKKSGLGMLGKNKSFIHPTYGSYVFIGCILTDCPIPPDAPYPSDCIGCDKCIKSCPAGALTQTGVDGEKCISHITQKKGELSKSEEALLIDNNCLWGCDICQEVCPHNKNIQKSTLPEFTQDLIYNLPEVDNLSNREFKQKYGKNAFSWRGKSVIVRNNKLNAKDKGKI